MSRQAEALEIDTEYFAIAGTPLRVSPVAIGTWAIGGWMWGGTDEAESAFHHPRCIGPWYQCH